ncbi:hypothetical protein EDD29_5158 [Actinocorallia herbida]|uniref:AbrB family transcriptional regulator n=1 Tax=Actinocorallia herbida TaxID=58109 RepID=A0A3N1D3B8_9ACTN|nr:hypothetical protein EDD29_5158 [Actinocorallia herbida]
MRQRSLDFLVWGAILAAMAAVGELGELGEPVIPSPHLLMPLACGMLAALNGLVRDHRPPAILSRGCQALLGVLIGSYLDTSALSEVVGEAAPLVTVTLATLVICQAAAWFMVRFNGMDRATATLGMTAGGSAAAIASAEDLGADGRQVAFMQYLRLVLIVVSTPMLLSWFLSAPRPAPGGAPAGTSWPLVSGPDQLHGLLVLAGIAVAGQITGRVLRLPSPATLGPMLMAALVTVTGLAHGFAPQGALRTVLFTTVGLEVGLRFSRRTVWRLRRILPATLLCTVIVSAACGTLAWVVSRFTRIPFADSYLATTPGGINAVLATASSMHADVPLVSSVQGLRLFAVALIAPVVIKLTLRVWTRRQRGPGPSA